MLGAIGFARTAYRAVKRSRNNGSWATSGGGAASSDDATLEPPPLAATSVRRVIALLVPSALAIAACSAVIHDAESDPARTFILIGGYLSIAFAIALFYAARTYQAQRLGTSMLHLFAGLTMVLTGHIVLPAKSGDAVGLPLLFAILAFVTTVLDHPTTVAEAPRGD